MTMEQLLARFIERKPARGYEDHGVLLYDGTTFCLNKKSKDKNPQTKFNYTFDELHTEGGNIIAVYIKELNTYWLDAEAHRVGRRRHSAWNMARTIEFHKPSARIMTFPFRLLMSLVDNDGATGVGIGWSWRHVYDEWKLYRALNSIQLFDGSSSAGIRVDGMLLGDKLYRKYTHDRWRMVMPDTIKAIFNGTAEDLLNAMVLEVPTMNTSDTVSGIALRDMHFNAERQRDNIVCMSPAVMYDAACNGLLPSRFKEIALTRAETILKLVQCAYENMEILRIAKDLSEKARQSTNNIDSHALRAIQSKWLNLYSDKTLKESTYSEETKEKHRQVRDKLLDIIGVTTSEDYSFCIDAWYDMRLTPESRVAEETTGDSIQRSTLIAITREEMEQYPIKEGTFHRPSGIAFKYYRPCFVDSIKNNTVHTTVAEYNPFEDSPQVKRRLEYWTSGNDEGQFYLSRLPRIRSVDTINEDFMPDAVRDATTEVLRQGDWFFVYHSHMDDFIEELGASRSVVLKSFQSQALPSNKVEGNMHVVKQFKHKGKIYCTGRVYHRNERGFASNEHRTLRLGTDKVFVAYQNTAIINFSVQGRGVD